MAPENPGEVFWDASMAPDLYSGISLSSWGLWHVTHVTIPSSVSGNIMLSFFSVLLIWARLSAEGFRTCLSCRELRLVFI